MMEIIQIETQGFCPITKEKEKKILVNYKHVNDIRTGGDYERVGLECPDVGDACSNGCPIFINSNLRVKK